MNVNLMHGYPEKLPVTHTRRFSLQASHPVLVSVRITKERIIV